MLICVRKIKKIVSSVLFSFVQNVNLKTMFPEKRVNKHLSTKKIKEKCAIEQNGIEFECKSAPFTDKDTV